MNHKPDIQPQHLCVTRHAFIEMTRIAQVEMGATLKEAYYCVSDYLEATGHHCHFSSFESFQNAYYQDLRRELGR